MSYNFNNLLQHSKSRHGVHLAPFDEGNCDDMVKDWSIGEGAAGKKISYRGADLSYWKCGLLTREEGDVVMIHAHGCEGRDLIGSCKGILVERGHIPQQERMNSTQLSVLMRPFLYAKVHIIIKACCSEFFAKCFAGIMKGHRYPPLSVWGTDDDLRGTTLNPAAVFDQVM